MVNDESIKKDIMDQLYWDSRVDATDVTVEVSKGVVTIKGTVPTYRAREAAYDNCFTIRGVVGVNEDLKVKYPDKIPSDEEMKDDAEKNLMYSPDIDSRKIEVNVNEGIAELKGSVDTLWKKYIAESEAGATIGVAGVINHLTVVPTKTVPDEDIAEDLMNALTRNSLVDETKLTVKVEDGIVHLKGEVPSLTEKKEAMDSAYLTAGVIDLKSDDLVVSQEA
jgi:osmotically-inducible protein OsmY